MKLRQKKTRAERRRREGRERRSNGRGDVSSGWEDVLCDSAMRDIGTTEKRCWAAPKAIEGGFVVGDATANPTANE